MRIGAEQVGATIERVYEAALDPALWPAALTAIADLTGSVGTSLILQDKRGGARTKVLAGRIDQAIVELFVRRHIGAPENPWTQTTQALPRGVARVTELVPTEVFVRSAFYHEVERPQNILHQVCAVLDCDAARSDRLGVFRTPAAGPGGEPEMHLLAQLAPHVRRALLVASRLEHDALRGNATFAALDRLAQGVVLLDENGRVLHANAAAEAILAAGDGLFCRGGMLTALLSFESIALAAAIVARAGGPLRISRRRGGHPYVAVVAPIGPEHAWPPAASPTTLLFVTDVDAGFRGGTATLRLLYGLTRAELGVAVAIAAGHGLPAAARQLGVSPHTVHAQLKRVFDKTGVQSQAALARLFARLAPML